MTTETPTTPAPNSTPAPDAALVARVAALEGENKVLAETLSKANGTVAQTGAQLAALTTERDAFKVQIADLTPKAVRLVELEATVATLTNDKREASFIEALRGKLPGAEPLAIRGVLGELHKAGKVNRYPEDAAAELAKALPIITAEVPSLARPLTSGGGSAGASKTPPKTGYRGPFAK